MDRIKKYWRWLFPADPRLGLDIDQPGVRDFFMKENFIKRRNKITLVVTLAGGLLVAWWLFRNAYISKDSFGVILASILGGFTGSAVNYLISNK